MKLAQVSSSYKTFRKSEQNTYRLVESTSSIKAMTDCDKRKQSDDVNKSEERMPTWSVPSQPQSG